LFIPLNQTFYMLIQQKSTGSKEMFYVEIDGNIVAEMVYTLPSPDKMIIEHTEVDESLKGKKVGYQLVHHGVEYAREKGMKIIPLCSFARSVFEKTSEFRDVLA
ncbi:GNAT family N-acetyltransferase, partial [Stenotrophomonas sp. CASM114]|uniref:GNAT family N-acetyltransferase n=1 Tax=Stenotrophomonas sp. CASM114 TaxID=3111512 RepID=UPI003BF8E19B